MLKWELKNDNLINVIILVKTKEMKNTLSILLMIMVVVVVPTTTVVYGLESDKEERLFDRGLDASTDYFKKKNALCTELEALGVLEEKIPEEFKDLVTPEIHADCRHFLYDK